MGKAYVGKCKCGAILAATLIESDDGDRQDAKTLAKDVSEFIKQGLEVSIVENEEVRLSFGGCICPKP